MADRFEQLGRLVEPGARAPDDGVADVRRRKRRRDQRRWGLAALALVVGLGLWRARAPEPVRPSPTMTRLTAQSVVVPAESGLGWVVVEGGATFEVPPRADRAVTVVAGEVVVRVLGTRFTVERAPDAVRVAVARGRVAVRWPGGEVELTAGADRRFVTEAPRPALPTDAAPAPDLAVPDAGLPDARVVDAAPPRRPVSAARRRVPKDWRRLARADVKAAWRALEAAPPVHAVVDLLLAADVARRAGQPRAALRYLERVVADYPSHGQAHLAAFTAARLWLDRLGQPRKAERLLHVVLAKGLDGALASEALARLVEVYARTGRPAQARKTATRFERLFPGSPHRARVQRWARP